VTNDGAVTDVAVNSGGKRYNHTTGGVGDLITIADDLNGGIDSYSATLRVTGSTIAGVVTTLGPIVTQSGTFGTYKGVTTTTDGSGVGLTVDVVTNAGVVTDVAVNSGGSGYNHTTGGVGDLITIAGGLIGGTDSDSVTLRVTGSTIEGQEESISGGKIGLTFKQRELR